MRTFPYVVRRWLAIPPLRAALASLTHASRATPRRDVIYLSAWGVREAGLAAAVGLALTTGGVVWGEAEVMRMAGFGDLGTALWRLKGDNLASIGDAVGVLERLLDERGGRSIVINSGGVTELVGVVKRGKDLGGTVVLGACRILGDLAGYEKGEDVGEITRRKGTMLEQGVAEALTGVLRECGGVAAGRPTGWMSWIGGWVGLGKANGNEAGDKRAMWEKNLVDGVTCHAVRCVGELARMGEGRERLRDAGVIECFANVLLNVPTGKIEKASSLREALGKEELAETLRHAVLGLAALSETFPLDVVASGSLSALAQLTAQSIDETTQAYAAKALRNLSMNSEAHRDMVLAGVGPALGKAIVNESNSRSQIRALNALGHLVSSDHPKAKVIRRRLAPELVALPKVLANTDDVKVQKAAGRALQVTYDSIDITENAFRPLRDAIDRHLVRLIYLIGVPECSSLAMQVLQSVSVDPHLAGAIIAKQGAEQIMTKMQSDDKELAGIAADALAKLTDHVDVMPKELRNKLLKVVISHPSGYHGGKPTATILANLARMDDNRIEFAAEGPMRILMQLANSHDKNARTAQAEVARAIHNMSLDGISGSNVVHSGGVPILLQLALKKGAARRYAVASITNLSESHSDSQANAAVILSAGAVPLLTKMAEEDQDIVGDVVECFALLSNMQSTHKSIAQSGLMLLFRTLENGEEDAQAMSAYAICNVASTEELRPLILKSPRFMSILEHSAHAKASLEVSRICEHALDNLQGKQPLIFLRAERRSRPIAA